MREGLPVSSITLVLGALYGSDDPAMKTALTRGAGACCRVQDRQQGGLICQELDLKQAEGSQFASPHRGILQKRPLPGTMPPLQRTFWGISAHPRKNGVQL